MKPIKWLALAGTAALLAACGSKQEASKSNFEKAINDFAGQERVCLPLGVGMDAEQGIDAMASGMLGDKQIRIPLKNTQGSRINKQALKQMEVLVDADLYAQGEDSTQAVGLGGASIPVAVFNRTEKGDNQVLPSPHGPLLCLGTQKVGDVVLFTEPTAANGVTISKVVYQAELVPEKWLKKLLKNSDKELAERVEAPQRQSVTLVLTNQGWRDLRELR